MHRAANGRAWTPGASGGRRHRRQLPPRPRRSSRPAAMTGGRGCCQSSWRSQSPQRGKNVGGGGADLSKALCRPPAAVLVSALRCPSSGRSRSRPRRRVPCGAPPDSRPAENRLLPLLQPRTGSRKRPLPSFGRLQVTMCQIKNDCSH